MLDKQKEKSDGKSWQSVCRNGDRGDVPLHLHYCDFHARASLGGVGANHDLKQRSTPSHRQPSHPSLRVEGLTLC